MGKKKINFFDSVEFVGDWEFVKEKKQRVRIKYEKQINSQFYLTFNEVTPLYTFLYLALAPEEAFGFQKVQPILDKLRGETEEDKQVFQQLRRYLSLQCDTDKCLAKQMRNLREQVGRQEKAILQVGSKITEEEAKQLLRSGLSQRKVHIDFHTNDGVTEEEIIPIQNVKDCISIIYEERNGKFLLAFLSHVEEEEKKSEDNMPLTDGPKAAEQEQRLDISQNKVRQSQQRQHQLRDRPVMGDTRLNFDERQLDNVKNLQPPSVTHLSGSRKVFNPDEKFLIPPEGHKSFLQRDKTKIAIGLQPRENAEKKFEVKETKEQKQLNGNLGFKENIRNIKKASKNKVTGNDLNPELKPINSIKSQKKVNEVKITCDNLNKTSNQRRRNLHREDQELPHPISFFVGFSNQKPRKMSACLQSKKRSDRVSTRNLAQSKTSSRKLDQSNNSSRVDELKQEVRELGEKAGEKIQALGEKVVDLGKKAEYKIEEVIEDIRKDGAPWVNYAVAGAIFATALQILKV